jgi:hypothetical protein
MASFAYGEHFRRLCNSKPVTPVQSRVTWHLANSGRMKHARALCALLIAFTFSTRWLHSEQIAVTQKQGAIHGFLLLLDGNGKQIAVGDQINIVKGNDIQSRLIFRFRDGSIDDETTVYSQGSVFQLIHYHHIQKGPSFPTPIDVSIDAPAGEVTWTDNSGKEQKKKSQRIDLPSDLVNGMIALAVENFPHGAGDLKLSYLAVSPKPRVVHVIVTADGQEPSQIGTSSRNAERFNLHFDLGGMAGVVAPVIGKQPPDIKLWVSDRAGSNFRQDGRSALRKRAKLDYGPDSANMA